MDDRYYWADVFTNLHSLLIHVEDATKARLRTDTGVWIEKFDASAPLGEGGVSTAGGVPPPGTPGATSPEMDEMYRRRYNMGGRGGANPEAPPAAPAADAGAPKPKGASNVVDTITVTFRAVSMTQVSGQADANKEIFYSVLNEIKASPFFVPEETRDTGGISPDEPPGTFTFGVTAKLKRPLKLF